jgi:predicted MFS family arabinose efflux permease
MVTMEGRPSAPPDWFRHLRSAPLRAGFGIGFCILFAFIGTFTYVNFVLVAPPLSLGPMSLGLVYFVFLPSVVTTLFAGRAAQTFGVRPAFWGALALAGVGLPLLLTGHLPAVLVGLALAAIGMFFAQAVATGFVGRAVTDDKGTASGIYLTCYFSGGLAGTALLGQMFDRFGWGACVAGIALSLVLAAILAVRLKPIRQS